MNGTPLQQGQIVLERVQPGSEAATLPQLQPGLVLKQIGGSSVRGRPAEAALNLVQCKSSRPLTLLFTRPANSPETAAPMHVVGAAAFRRGIGRRDGIAMQRPPVPRWPAVCGKAPCGLLSNRADRPITLLHRADCRRTGVLGTFAGCVSVQCASQLL